MSVGTEQVDLLLLLHCPFWATAGFVHVLGTPCIEQVQAVIPVEVWSWFFCCLLHSNAHVLPLAICTLEKRKSEEKNPTLKHTQKTGSAAWQNCLYP